MQKLPPKPRTIVEALKNRAYSDPPANHLLSYRAGADQLCVSLNHFRGLIDAGYIASVQVGRRGKRVRAADIDFIVANGVHLTGGNAQSKKITATAKASGHAT